MSLYDLSVANMITLDDTEEAEPSELLTNRICTQVRLCFANEVKSAKELKISLRQDTPLFYPNVQFGIHTDRLDMRTKKPVAIQTDQRIGLAEDMDKWLLNH
jgi:hypothetical protein